MGGSETPVAQGLAELGPSPSSFTSSEFQQALEIVREKAPQRFCHANEVLRMVDCDYDGRITRNELRHFFRAFGVSEEVADKFFKRLAIGNSSQVSHSDFVKLIGPYLELPGIGAVMQKSSCTVAKHPPADILVLPDAANGAARIAVHPRRQMAEHLGQCQ